MFRSFIQSWLHRPHQTTVLYWAYSAATAWVWIIVFSALLPAQEIDDRKIEEFVAQQLLFADSVATDSVRVTSRDGIVTLAGSVDNILARHEALQIAGRTRGVRSVVNRIQVDAPSVEDEQLERDISVALGDDPATESYDVTVAVRDGQVSLSGTVQSQAEKKLSGVVAAGVRGVRDLRNEIIVKAEDDRPDSEIKHDIQRRMEASAWIDSGRIDVEVRDGSVQLSGLVGSVAEHLRIRDAAWVAGVRAVQHEDLKVATGAQSPLHRTRSAKDITDKEIQQAVRDTLRYDPRVSRSDVRVAVEDRAVTLRGNVGHLAAKVAAETDAWNTFGVRRVYNDLRVRPANDSSDARIETVAERMVAVDPYVSRYQVHVDVKDGHAYLHGQVRSNFDKLRAQELVSRAQGVLFVTNRITVERPWVEKSDEELKEGVRLRLWWSSELESREINVTVENGIATLTGTVASHRERELARQIALDAGVKKAISNLAIKDDSPSSQRFQRPQESQRQPASEGPPIEEEGS